MVLYFIGLGLFNEQDISLRGLEIIKKCDYVYLEEYTSRLIEFDMVIGKNFLLTNHHRDLESIKELKDDPQKVQKLLAKGPAYLAHHILDKEIDKIPTVLESFEEAIEKLERELTRDPDRKYIEELFDRKKTLSEFKRSALQQKEKQASLGM